MSKGVAVLVWGLGGIIVPLLLLFGTIYFFHERIVNSIYKNVEDISDNQMPPTVTSFQSGPEVVSTIGGGGEGLNCSLPRLANSLFDRMEYGNGNRRLVLQRFRQACVFHDLCYRHGLATYGYTQNDCDQVLQNEAFRICKNVRSGKPEGVERCQTDSKMILAGVTFGGSDAFRAWDRSTYFEFEADPWRSSGFSVSRVVDHPFKSVNPDKYREDPDQVILTFENIRSNLTVRCVTCKEVPLLEKTNDRYDISPEFRSVGIKKLPDALLNRDGLMLSSRNTVWLPPRRHHAAPHLLVDSAGKNHLVWMTRNNPGDTITCVVLADAARLLTYTLPEGDLCSEAAGSQLTMVEFNTFSTSPLPMEIPRRASDGIFATGISLRPSGADADKDDRPRDIDFRELSFCTRSASRTVDSVREHEDDKSKCVPFPDQVDLNSSGLGAFQNFVTVRLGQQILFARDVVTSRDVPLWTKISQNVLGIEYSPKGVMLQIDVAAPSTVRGPVATRIKRKEFNIPDRFDPMMPITRIRDDLRFLSLERTDDEVGLRLFNFAKEHPEEVEKVKLWMRDSEVTLHSSWALRPALVLETREDGLKTKLVFSRAEIAPQPKDPASVATTESLTLETLVFERKADAPPDVAFVETSGAACTIKYTFESHPEYPCYRSFDPTRPMRASPAASMQASQTLVGRFAGRGGYSLAFPDACLNAEPVMILKPMDTTFVPASDEAGWPDIQRHVSCHPIPSNADISRPIRHQPAEPRG